MTMDATEEVEAVEADEADEADEEMTDELLFGFDEELPADETLFADDADGFETAESAEVLPSRLPTPAVLSLHRFRSFKA